MNDVQFNEETGLSRTHTNTPLPNEAKGIVGFLLKKEIVKTTAQANTLLIVTFCILLVLTGFLLIQNFYMPSSTNQPSIPYEQI